MIDYGDPSTWDSSIEENNIIDPLYGELKAYYKSWGDLDNPGVFYQELQTRPCTKSELLLEESTGSKKFWAYEPEDLTFI